MEYPPEHIISVNLKNTASWASVLDKSLVPTVVGILNQRQGGRFFLKNETPHKDLAKNLDVFLSQFEVKLMGCFPSVPLRLVTVHGSCTQNLQVVIEAHDLECFFASSFECYEAARTRVTPVDSIGAVSLMLRLGTTKHEADMVAKLTNAKYKYKSIVDLYERDSIQFKQSLPDRPEAKGKLPRYLSAFANHSGGAILFGIKDDGTVKGCFDPNLAFWANEFQELASCMDPPIQVQLLKLPVEGGGYGKSPKFIYTLIVPAMPGHLVCVYPPVAWIGCPPIRMDPSIFRKELLISIEKNRIGTRKPTTSGPSGEGKSMLKDVRWKTIMNERVQKSAAAWAKIPNPTTPKPALTSDFEHSPASWTATCTYQEDGRVYVGIGKGSDQKMAESLAAYDILVQLHNAL